MASCQQLFFDNALFHKEKQQSWDFVEERDMLLCCLAKHFIYVTKLFQIYLTYISHMTYIIIDWQ